MLPIVIITYKRPQYLQRTICSFIEQNKNNLDMFSLRILIQGGLDKGTAEVIEKWKEYFDFIDVREKNEGCAQGYNISMQEALKLNTPYLLFLEDDWESKESLSNYLPEIFDLMNTDKTIGYIRLRNVNAKVWKTNVISKKPVKWDRTSKHILVSNAHFTFNPIILRCDVVEQMGVLKGEYHAQQKYHELELQVAQLDASCFCHIGDERVSDWIK